MKGSEKIAIRKSNLTRRFNYQIIRQGKKRHFNAAARKSATANTVGESTEIL
ncbi:hypothetical protein IEE83_18955 [Dyadobacter sp. UP-52]|uniref:Uncharacterized protein n=1 Tax=Dyadobacter subterraneus TaxID=2773304 RepID=A0ABR9WEZ7_9BACT|nr:hypothetical protein [Dyadobacter subterraneus]